MESEKKLKNLLKKLEAHPQDPAILLELGNKYIELGEHASAIQMLKQILSDDPNHGTALNNIAYSHEELGREEKAKKYYIKAIRSNFNSAAVPWSNLASLYIKREHSQKFEFCMRMALSIDPTLFGGPQPNHDYNYYS